MSAGIDDKDRQVIPRWRLYGDALRLGELRSLEEVSAQSLDPSGQGRRSFEESLAAWRANQGLALASDVFGSALVLDRAEDARDVAEYLLASGSAATTSTRRLLEPFLSAEHVDMPHRDLPSVEALRKEIAHTRRYLAADPRNSILWVDLARHHATLGNISHAERALRIALGGAGGNRFVLRSAARFFVHIGDPEQAHEILRRVDGIQADPWLLSAEIAVASLAKRTSRFAKVGLRSLQTETWAAAQTTELKSALGTLELAAGDKRSAKKLFRTALEDPTENSVAQVEWASRTQLGLDLSPSVFNTPGSFEARARDARAAGKWNESFAEAAAWFADQPFSKDASSFASYIATVPLERYSDGVSILNSALIAMPRDPLLLNNLAFALASLEKVDEAIDVFGRISRIDSPASLETTLLATHGLLAYRTGDVAQGQRLYEAAIASARARNALFEAALASLFYVREARHAKAGNAQAAWQLATELASDRSEPEVRTLLSRLGNEVAS